MDDTTDKTITTDQVRSVVQGIFDRYRSRYLRAGSIEDFIMAIITKNDDHVSAFINAYQKETKNGRS